MNKNLISVAKQWWIRAEKESILTIEEEFEDGPEKERMLRECKKELEKKKKMTDEEIIEITMQYAIWCFEGAYENKFDHIKPT